MTIFAEVTVNDCINGGHLRNNEYIQFGAQQRPKWHLYFTKTDTPCSSVSLRQLSHVLHVWYAWTAHVINTQVEC